MNILYLGVIFNPFSTFQFFPNRMRPPLHPHLFPVYPEPIIKLASIYASGALTHTKVPFGTQGEYSSDQENVKVLCNEGLFSLHLKMYKLVSAYLRQSPENKSV